MSADNWTTCPRCARRRARAIADKAAEVEAAYGNVSVGDFDAMRTALEAARAETLRPTFREDYELGIDDDSFYVRYSGGCSECGLAHIFEHDDNLTVEQVSS